MSVWRGAWVLVFVAMSLGATRARAQFFSPGPLARPHAALEGLTSCARCHEQRQGLSAARCLTCHTELAPSRDQRTGLHGRLSGAVRDQCQRCHPDHRGRAFSLIDWGGDRKTFDHARTGWPLAGAHGALDCQSCHDARHVVAPEIARMLRAQPARTTYLGLSRRCDACHYDEHRDQVGRECQRCHGEKTWKPAAFFDHDKTAFALRGAHGPLACGGCHATLRDADPSPPLFPARRAATFLRLSPLDHTTCASCHADPHEGKLGPACANCHREDSWRKISTPGRGDRTFHDNTRFPLEGAHIGVACKSCHGPAAGQPARFRGLPFGRCGDCHADAHVGQLSVGTNGRAADCGVCHVVSGFAPARFEAEQHAATGFPLEGGHRATACRGCHPVDARLADQFPRATRARLERAHRPVLVSLSVMRPHQSAERCAGCHADPHDGQFAAGPGAPRDCAACHTTTSFRALAFDHATDTRFALTGAHGRAACDSCHKRASLRPGATPVVRYRPLAMGCGSCHRDPHQGQFTWQLARVDAFAPPVRRADAKDCGACHDTTRFDRTTFRHDDGRATTFALEGKHARLPCASCHPQVRVAADVAAVRYRPLPRTCGGCHADFHKGDFRGFIP